MGNILPGQVLCILPFVLSVIMCVQQNTTQYSPEDLTRIEAELKKVRVPPDVYHYLKDLGISSAKPTRREKRSWTKLQKKIRVIISNGREYIRHNPKCKRSSARKIIYLDHIRMPPKAKNPVKIGLWNAHSMINKPTEVCDLVLTEELTEAWLRGDSRDGPALADIRSTLREHHLLKLP